MKKISLADQKTLIQILARALKVEVKQQQKRDSNKVSGQRKDVIKLLKKHRRPLAPKDVAVKLGKEGGAARKLLWTMARDGIVVADDRGRYALTAKARRNMQ